MTRSLGDYYMQWHGVTWEPAVSCIDLFDLVTQLSQVTLVIASDGLWDDMSSERAVSIVRKSTKAQPAAEALAREVR